MCINAWTNVKYINNSSGWYDAGSDKPCYDIIFVARCWKHSGPDVYTSPALLNLDNWEALWLDNAS